MRGASAAALELRGARLVWGARTHVMGIVNATPDSFSGDGRASADAAVAHALAQLAAGADLVDVGAESTRPGATPLGEAQELARLLPVVRGVRARAPGAIMSVDTYRPAVFAAAHAAGADVCNAVGGASPELLATVARLRAPVVLMRGLGRKPEPAARAAGAAFAELAAAGAAALAAGLPREAVLLDPGIGFGQSAEGNLAILAALDGLVALGFPTLVGASRKSTLGLLTGRAAADRDAATCAVTALAARAGVDVVRVHAVAAAVDVCRVTDAVRRGWRPPAWPAAAQPAEPVGPAEPARSGGRGTPA